MNKELFIKNVQTLETYERFYITMHKLTNGAMDFLELKPVEDLYNMLSKLLSYNMGESDDNLSLIDYYICECLDNPDVDIKNVEGLLEE